MNRRTLKNCLHFLIGLGGIGLVALVSVLLIARGKVQGAAEGQVFHLVEKTPKSQIGVVLGTSPVLPDGRANLYFQYRMDATAALYHAGKIEWVLASGANPVSHYDESTAMRQALVERGVPEERIFRDFAGFRTLDSIVRAKEVFQIDSFLVISQDFHVRRAIYLGQAHDIDVVGFAARDVPAVVGLKTMVREELARVKAVLDVTVLRTEPKFLGPPVHLAMNEPATGSPD
ncbi:MAG: ElyC/SanA/YdcF family protein [Verrucomicrobiota bacterium]